MVPSGRRAAAATLAALLLVASTAEAAIWDNWPGLGATTNNNNKPTTDDAPVAAGGAATTGDLVAPNPRPSVLPSILGGGGGGGNAVDAGAGIPADLDLEGIDAHSLITPAAAGHAVPPGKCGVYTRGAAEVAICVDSLVTFGTDLTQLNGFLVNRGGVGLCDLIVRPVVPEGAFLASFWPDWALDNLQDIYLDPGLTTAVGLTMRPNSAPADALPRVDVYAFKDCSRSADEVASGATTFRLVDIEEVVSSAIEVLAFEDKAAAAAAAVDAAAAPLAPAPFNGHFIREGECAVYTKPAAGKYAAQATLCVDSITRAHGSVVQMNGFLVNTGRAPLCEVRLGIDPHQQYLSIWPLWAQQGEWLDDFRPGQAVAVGFAAPDARADSAFPPLVLEDFDICGHPTGKPVGGMTRNAATGEISFPRALEATTVRMADAVGLPKLQRRTQATPAAVDPVSASKATPAGKCAVYQKGAATLAMCADSVVQWGKDTQQVNGFMVNLGKTQLCDVRLEVVADSNKVYSFWPDWAETGSYEVYFSPQQVTAVGTTVAPCHEAPYVEVVAFRDCAAPEAQVEAPITGFELVDIEVVQPSDAEVSLIAEPDFEGVEAEEEQEDEEGDYEEYRRRRGLAGADLIPEGKCAIYTLGAGKLALCIESVLRFGELTQVNGYLENLGTERLCDLKVALAANTPLDSVWPKWALQGAYAGAFKPGQVSPIGAVVAAQPNASDPSIAVESFTLCDPDAPMPVDLVPVSLVSIAELKQVHLAAAPSTDKQAAEDNNKQQQEQEASAIGSPALASAVRPGRCGTASTSGGMFQLRLCVDEVQPFGADIAQLAGQVENVGKGSVCDLRVANGFAPEAVLTSWPEGTHQGKSVLAQPLAPGEKLNVGVTASHTRGLAAAREQGVLPFPSLAMVALRPCNQPANAAPLLLKLVEEGPLPPPPLVDLLGGRADDAVFENVPGGRRGLAMKGGAAPTTMDTIDWDLCGYYTGKDGQSELALCWKDAKTWKDREAGRVVQTNLVLVNTGKFGVCNVTVEIENIDQELGDHYPQDWIDEDGNDIFPTYPGYYAPEQIVNIGAAVPVRSGFPEVGIAPDFVACSPPPPKPTKPRKAACEEVTNAAGVKLNLCLYSKYKEWVEYNGPRVVMVEGYIENVGTETACNIHVDIENFARAQSSWGEWMPDFPYKLSPGATLKFGANIPQKKGTPKASIGSFEKCDAVVKE